MQSLFSFSNSKPHPTGWKFKMSEAADRKSLDAEADDLAIESSAQHTDSSVLTSKESYVASTKENETSDVGVEEKTEAADKPAPEESERLDSDLTSVVENVTGETETVESSSENVESDPYKNIGLEKTNLTSANESEKDESSVKDTESFSEESSTEKSDVVPTDETDVSKLDAVCDDEDKRQPESIIKDVRAEWRSDVLLNSNDVNSSATMCSDASKLSDDSKEPKGILATICFNSLHLDEYSSKKQKVSHT